MKFFKFTRRESRPGSARYARELADCMNEDLEGLGPTDAGIAADALRSYAGRWRRRYAAGLVAVGLAVFSIVGVDDRNRDGRVDGADVVLGLQSALAASALPVFGTIRGDRHGRD